MMRSLYSGVSGLQNHQTRMDVVGNNISNINTTGFKKARVVFQDMLYQQSAGAAKPTASIGGVNPKEVGLGMSVASIDTIHTQGSLQTTGNQTDLAIMGQGFFVLREGENQLYTRAGDFNVDKDGTFVNPANGMKVQGWMAEMIDGVATLNTSRDVGNITIPVGGKDPAKGTTNIEFACNLDKRTPFIPAENPSALDIAKGTWNTQIKIYDSFGTEHVMQAVFTRARDDAGAETPNTWRVQLNVDPQDVVTADAAAGAAGGAAANYNPHNVGVAVPGAEEPAAGAGIPAGAAAADAVPTFYVRFDNNGTLANAALDVAGAAAARPAPGQVTLRMGYDVPATDPDAAGAAVRQYYTLDLGNTGGFTRAITQFASDSSSKAVTQDGYTMGYLENFKIDQSGTVTGVYSNGTNRTLAQIALATFTNQSGLEKNGDTAFLVSNNSGNANIGPSGIAGKGKIISGTLEMSNVDMAAEMTDMIVTQRGFQANSRTIQTSDQMLQELLTLKR